MNHQATSLLVSLCLGLALSPCSQAADILKDDNSTDLDQTGSWVGGGLPTGADVAVWDGTVATATGANLGAGAQFNSLRFANPVNDFTITGNPGISLLLESTSPFGTPGLDLTAATRDLILNCDVNPANNQSWSIAAGRKLTVGGDLQFRVASAVLWKLGDGTLELTSTKTTTDGDLRLARGTTLLTGGDDRLPINVVLRIGATNGPTATLDLGGYTHTIGRMILPFTDTTNANRAVLTNGSILMQGVGGSGNTVFYNGNGSVYDMSGLNSLTANLSSPAVRNFNTQPYMQTTGSAAYNATNTTILAKTNLIRGNMTVGGSGTSGGIENLGRVLLGAVNDLRLGSLGVGGFNARGEFRFQDGLVDPTLTIRGLDGLSRLTNWTIGDTSSGTRPGWGTFDVSAGTVDIQASFLRLGREGAGNGPNESSSFKMSAGTVDVLEAQMGVKFGNGFTYEVVAANFHQLGGSVTISNLMMGTNAMAGGTFTNATPNWQTHYNLGAGTLRLANLFSGPGNNGASSVRALNLTNGTLRNYDLATDLLITNNPAYSNGVVVTAPGTGTRTLEADAGRSMVIAVPVKQSAVSDTPLIKAGAGTLDLSGAQDNPYTGLEVTAGTALLNKISSATVHALGNDSTISGGTLRLSGTGGDQIADTAAITVNSGAFDLNGQGETIAGLQGTGGTVSSVAPAALTLAPAAGPGYTSGSPFSGSFDLIKTGDGRQTYTGTDGRSAGTNAVDGGELVVNGSLSGATYVNSGGTLLGNGTLAGATVVAGGTVAPGTSIGKLTFTGGLTLQAGAVLALELDRSLSPAPTNDAVAVSGGFSGGGTLNVQNVGPALAAGDTFQLFNAAVTGFATVNLPAGYSWQNDLGVNGSIKVVAVTPDQPTLTYERDGSDYVFNWTPATGFKLQAQTNALSLGLSTNWADVTGGATPPVTVPFSAANPAVFFRLISTP